MTSIELDLWQELDALAATDALAAATVECYRHDFAPTPEILLRSILAYAKTTEVLRKMLVDAESRRPRVYYLEGPNVRLASGVAPTA